MKRPCLVSFLAIAMSTVFPIDDSKASTWLYINDGTETTLLGSNMAGFHWPRINNNGHVVWFSFGESSQEIFLYNGTSTIQLTNNAYDDEYPQINNSGYVVWSGQGIWLYDGATTTQIAASGDQPQINENGYVVWRGYDGSDHEIFLYDGTSTIQITNNDYADGGPQINDNGSVVWSGYLYPDEEIFLYDGTSTIQLTNNDSADQNPQINNNGYVVWAGCDGDDFYGDCFLGDWEVFLYDGASTTQLTNNDYDDGGYRYFGPQINDNGYVVWDGCDRFDCRREDGDGEIFLYDGTTTTQLTSNADGDISPQISNQGRVAWIGNWGGSDPEIIVYEGGGVIQLTDNYSVDTVLHMSDNGHIVWEEEQPNSWEAATVDGVRSQTASQSLNCMLLLVVPFASVLVISLRRSRR